MFNFTSILLFLTIATFPLYLLPSGGVQISHGFYVLFLLCFLPKLAYSRRIPAAVEVKKIFLALTIFVGIVCIVQFGYAAILLSPEMAKYGLFYIFNFVYVYTIYHYIRVYDQAGLNVIFLATFAAIAITFGGAVAGVTNVGYRMTSFFNNPNQLGYFALITTVIMLLFHTCSTVKYTRLFALTGVCFDLYLSSVSLSKAAMIATVICVVCFVPSFKKLELFFLTAIILITSPFWIQKITESNNYARVVQRIENIGKQKDDNLLGRGYGRIVRNPEYLFTGAGEGEYLRFNETLEIHSTFGNILFCYGIMGFLAFIFFNINCFRFAPYLFTIFFAGVFAYGVVHNGIRFSYFWLLFALFIFFAEQQKVAKRKWAFVPRFIANQNKNLQNQGQQLPGGYRNSVRGYQPNVSRRNPRDF